MLRVSQLLYMVSGRPHIKAPMPVYINCHLPQVIVDISLWSEGVLSGSDYIFITLVSVYILTVV